MSIGERIRFFRKQCGMTQKYLGMQVGFSEGNADIRIAQYEAGSRAPRKETMEAIAFNLDVSPQALNVPDIDTYTGLMHTLFAVEDLYGLTVERKGMDFVLKAQSLDKTEAAHLCALLGIWASVAEKYRTGQISKDEYDKWRYHYPEYESMTPHGKQHQSREHLCLADSSGL